ncbi:MAG: hypothetical protein U9Q07_04250 [Planctomycetota bacterium]|nr:hypothetical protein [Planctomycetota bacterium]
MGSQSPADWILQFAKVMSSSLIDPPSGGNTRPVQFSIEGTGDATDLDGFEGEIPTADDTGEKEDADIFGQIGIVARPLPPTTSGTVSEHAEVVCIRTSDGLVPVAARDIRLKMFGVAPNEGTVALVGYGGGYHSIAPVDNSDLTKGAIQTIYCPYDFNSSGVAQKAHSITIDPTAGNEAISVVHATAGSFLMYDGGVQPPWQRMQSPDGQTFVMVEDGKLTLQSDQLILNGGMVVVGNPLGPIVPLIAGIASPPCPRLFLNPS